jgi:hypothetical protein
VFNFRGAHGSSAYDESVSVPTRLRVMECPRCHAYPMLFLWRDLGTNELGCRECLRPRVPTLRRRPPKRTVTIHPGQERLFT